MGRVSECGTALRTAIDMHAALGRGVLDGVTAEARALDESVIRPGQVTVTADDAPISGRMAMTSLSPYLLLAALLVLLLDIILLVRSRRRASHA